MSRDYQDFQDYQYGNNEQYYFSNPQQTYYPNYPIQGDYYGPPGHVAQPYGSLYDYGSYSNLNYYNNYTHQDTLYDPSTYGYEGEYYQGVAQTTTDSNHGGQALANDNSALRQPARGKHSYSQNRNRNRQRSDAPFQGENKEKKGTGRNESDKKSEIDNFTAPGNASERLNVRGKKQGGRFFGSDTRSRTFENRGRKTDDAGVKHGENSVDASKFKDDIETQSRNDVREGLGAKPKGYRQQASRDDRGKSERGKIDRYGKENQPDRHVYSARRNEGIHVNEKNRETLNENINNSASTRDNEKRSSSQTGGVLKIDLRKDHRSGDEIAKTEKLDENDKASFEYRNDGGGLQKTQQGRYQKRMTRNRVTKKVDESQRGVLIDQLTRGTYECMVCCETVRAQNAVWSCSNCYHVFHLRCIKQWARSPNSIVAGSEKNGWRCPACQNLTFKFPSQYRCFCGKVRDPDFNRMEIPHSCGSVCQKDRGEGCKHPCIVLCHPGPCPECNAMVNKSCDCGKTKQLVKCGQSTVIKCSSTCDRQLNCGKHFCKAVCHAGPCEKCEEKVQQECYGGHEKREVDCGSSEDFAKSYSCGNICARVLDCGNHTCEVSCHPGSCESCPDLPSNVTHCPCGAVPLTDLSQEPRTSCMDPIPTCDNICNKELTCGPEGNHHRCKQVCHTGACGQCDGETEVTCRCGAMQKDFKCSELPKFQAENGQYLCDRICKRKKLCGRHKCGQNCCVRTEHPCELVCGRKLSCGLHQCEEPCHKGNCPPCLMASFDELTCTCGVEVLLPPIPCGTKPPECHQPCTRDHPCNHPVRHNCHSEEKCPPCTELTKKFCMGGHEMRANIPCSLQDISCGMPCRKPLPCGEHACQRVCHKGRCLEEGETCTQPCQRKRESCEHICGAPCHGEEPCPNTACKAQVTVKCPCGLREQKVTCSVGGPQDVGEYQKITMQSLADSIQNTLGVSSVNMSKFNKMGGGRIIECNEECALLERNKRFALALEIQNPDLTAKLGNPTYSDFLKDYAKQFPQFVAGIEKSLSELVQTAKQSKQPSRSHSFPIMSQNQRRCIHELAEHYGCETQSYDYEPKKNVVATAPRDKCWLPSVTLTALVQRELHPRAPPPIPHVHREDILRQNNMAAKQSTSLLGATADPLPNAWHTVGKKSKPSKTTTTSRLDKFDLGASDKPDYTKLSKETKEALKSEPVVDYFDFTFT